MKNKRIVFLTVMGVLTVVYVGVIIMQIVTTYEK